MSNQPLIFVYDNDQGQPRVTARDVANLADTVQDVSRKTLSALRLNYSIELAFAAPPSRGSLIIPFVAALLESGMHDRIVDALPPVLEGISTANDVLEFLFGDLGIVPLFIRRRRGERLPDPSPAHTQALASADVRSSIGMLIEVARVPGVDRVQIEYQGTVIELYPRPESVLDPQLERWINKNGSSRHPTSIVAASDPTEIRLAGKRGMALVGYIKDDEGLRDREELLLLWLSPSAPPQQGGEALIRGRYASQADLVDLELVGDLPSRQIDVDTVKGIFVVDQASVWV